MTNSQIILDESLRLLNDNLIKPTGRMLQLRNDDGSITELPEPEPIHTFQRWKELGFSVKKGEKAIAKFPIWKHTVKILDENTGNEAIDAMNAKINEQGGETKMFMKVSAFFAFSQVEPTKYKKALATA